MDCRLSFHEPVARVGPHNLIHNEESLQLTAPDLPEREAKVRCPAATLRPRAFRPVCAPTDVSRLLHCRDRRQSTADFSPPIASADPPSDPTSQRRAIASRQETTPADVPVARTR